MRIIPCCAFSKFDGRLILFLVKKAIIYLQLIVTVHFSNSSDSSLIHSVIFTLLVFRQSARIFTNPAASAIELCIAINIANREFTYFLVYSAMLQFILHRSYLLINKFTYMLVSVITAFKNKKQRIKYQAICFAI